MKTFGVVVKISILTKAKTEAEARAQVQRSIQYPGWDICEMNPEIEKVIPMGY